MLTENTLKNFSPDELCDLIILKLEELKTQKSGKDRELYEVTKKEIKLIQHLINQKKATTRPSM